MTPKPVIKNCLNLLNTCLVYVKLEPILKILGEEYIILSHWIYLHPQKLISLYLKLSCCVLFKVIKQLI